MNRQAILAKSAFKLLESGDVCVLVMFRIYSFLTISYQCASVRQCFIWNHITKQVVEGHKMLCVGFELFWNIDKWQCKCKRASSQLSI